MEETPPTPSTVNKQAERVLLQKKVVSSAGFIVIRGFWNFLGLFQFPLSDLTMTDTTIYLDGPLKKQTIPYDQIEKVELKSYTDRKLDGMGLFGKGIKIWRRGENILSPNREMVILIDPKPVLDILKQKRPDLFSTPQRPLG